MAHGIVFVAMLITHHTTPIPLIATLVFFTLMNLSSLVLEQCQPVCLNQASVGITWMERTWLWVDGVLFPREEVRQMFCTRLLCQEWQTHFVTNARSMVAKFQATCYVQDKLQAISIPARATVAVIFVFLLVLRLVVYVKININKITNYDGFRC